MKKHTTFKSVLLAGTLFFSTVAFAEILKDVSIEGTRRIESQTVKNYLHLSKGDNVTSADLDRAVKNLFATGLFSDVKVNMNKGVAEIKVVENPIVHDVYFEGNKKIDDDVLRSEVLLKPRMVYTQRKIQNDADRLLEVYKRHGRYSATVKPQIIKKDQNRVDVIFQIDEGEKAFVKNINILGNKAFSSKELKEQMVTQEKAWYRFFSSTDTYDPDRLNYDKELLRRFYLNRGYVDFKVNNSFAELTPDKESFIITLEIEEGNRYKFDEPEVKVNLPEYKNDIVFSKFMEFKKGDYFSSEHVEGTIEDLTQEFANRGYAFVEIEPEFQKTEESKTVKIVFHVRQGEKVFVNKINISGNSRTLDKVIRREFRLEEGDVFNASKLRRSKQKIENLDYFSKVDFKSTPVPGQPEKTDIDVDVDEKSTGSFNIGIGWSSYDGPLFETGVTERNILGTGNIASINALIAQKETQYTMGLTNPYFMDKRLSAGFDLFHTTRDNKDYSSYSYKTTGGLVRLGWNYTDHLGQSLKYTLKQDDIDDIDSDASVYIKEQKGKNTVSMIGQELFYDRRDSRINPTQGYYLSFGTDLAGIGGDTKFVRFDLMGIKYFPVTDDVIFSLRGDVGRIWGIGGEDVRVNNRYFLGDVSLRGFEWGGVGARDKSTNDALGGNWYTSASAELVFPIGLPKEIGIRGKVFSDAAVVGKPDNYNPRTMDYSDKLRLSVGTGILWQSPMGMINFDFSYPILKEDYDETRVFRLNFGNRF
ncbi:MAG: outer membrane protein assembly factor BamA [Lactobacillales bacterium]|jgi:outer membrane protein insertion porin family|nr:outer membrane protein assembly factor BamA [Lactobacillales bacterium]